MKLNVTLKNAAIVGGSSILVATASLVMARHMGPDDAAVEDKSFTATVVTLHRDQNDVQKAVTTSVHAGRADGSYVDAYLSQNKNPLMRKVIVDLQSKRQVTVDQRTESVTTYSLSDDWLKSIRRRNACPASLTGERSSLLGYEVVHFVRTRKTSRMVERTEAWLAPALSCYPLRAEVFLTVNGEPGGHNVTEVISLTEGEPDQNLFSVPQGYVERTPSQVFKEAARREGKPCRECGQHAQVLDEVYRRAAQP